MAPVAQMVRIEMEKVKISVKRYARYIIIGKAICSENSSIGILIAIIDKVLKGNLQSPISFNSLVCSKNESLLKFLKNSDCKNQIAL